jgi:hypothetical protein
MKMMITFCVNFCMINSCIAVPTLAIFAWVSRVKYELLEIEQDSRHEATKILIGSTILYAVLALLLCAYKGIFAQFSSNVRRSSLMTGHAEGQDKFVTSLMANSDMSDEVEKSEELTLKGSDGSGKPVEDRRDLVD